MCGRLSIISVVAIDLFSITLGDGPMAAGSQFDAADKHINWQLYFGYVSCEDERIRQ